MASMTDPRTSEPDAPETGSIIKDLGSFFTSVQTTVTLLFFLAAASLIGTVMPQAAPLQQIQGAGDSFYYRVAVILDLHNLYRSWWFILLLVLLALNLLGCLIRRLPVIPGEWRGDEKKSSFILNLVHKGSISGLKDLLVSALKPVLGKTPAVTEGLDRTTLLWVRHRVYLLGFPLIHLAIIVILAGGLLGLLYGYRGYIEIPEGEAGSQYTLYPSGPTRSLPFRIAVDSFTMTRYPTGEPKEYRSDVSILKNDKEVVKGSILVNHPLTFEGISLYQSDYKIAGVKEVLFEVLAADGKPTELVVRPRTPAELSDTPYLLRVLRTDPGTTKRGAGVEISVEAPGEKPKVAKLFRKDSEPLKIGGTEIRFLDYQPLYATGLQIGYDPGSVLVWVGCCLLIGGFMLTLFTNLRHLKVELENGEDEVNIRVTGRSRRMRREFRETIEEKVRDCLNRARQQS
jgi:cytochrome c biogenesis protein